jgi:hypothetical protein
MTHKNTMIDGPAQADYRKRKRISAIFTQVFASLTLENACGQDSSRPAPEPCSQQPKVKSDARAKWGQFLITPAFFTRLVYEGA